MCLKKIIVQASTKRQKHQISMKNVMFMSAKTVLSNILPVVNQKRYKLYEIFVSTVVEIREKILTRRKFTNVLKLVLSCVCVCVYTLLPVGFFWLHDVCDLREKFGSTIFCCEYWLGAFCQVPSSLFPNLSYFTSKDVTPARRKTGEKTNDIMLTFQKDDLYGYRI